jgi:2,4-didehydro-3-deoxy-L-rhamnonate hydrolase
MRFARLGAAGAEIPVVIDAQRTLDLRPVTADIDGAFLAGDCAARVRAARRTGGLS